jgi:hypothetical protein
MCWTVASVVGPGTGVSGMPVTSNNTVHFFDKKKYLPEFSSQLACYEGQDRKEGHHAFLVGLHNGASGGMVTCSTQLVH